MTRPPRVIRARAFAKLLARWGAPADFQDWLNRCAPDASATDVIDAIPVTRARWYWWLNGAIYKHLPELAANVFNQQDASHYASFMHTFDETAYDLPARDQAFMRYKRRAASLISVMLIYIAAHHGPRPVTQR